MFYILTCSNFDFQSFIYFYYKNEKKSYGTLRVFLLMSEELFYSLAEKGLFRTETAKTKIHWTLKDSKKINK